MSELIDRLISRTESDLRRGIDFSVGMRHLSELIQTTLMEIDVKMKYVEELIDRLRPRR